MSKTKRGKTRLPNRLKPLKKEKLGRAAAMMKVVEEPTPGLFYSIAHKLYDGDVDLLSEKVCRDGRVVIAEIPSGSMVWFLGGNQPPELLGKFYKVGYGEYFGYVSKYSVMFFDLGE